MPDGMKVERIEVTRTTRRLTRPVRTVTEYWSDDGELLASSVTDGKAEPRGSTAAANVEHERKAASGGDGDGEDIRFGGPGDGEEGNGFE